MYFMAKIKSFEGKHGVIEEIKKFLIEKDSPVALTNCDHIGLYESKFMCPHCDKRWNRLPKVEIFRELTYLYDATDTAWANLFGTNRSSVTRLRNKFNPKNITPVWTQDRFQKEINETGYHDKKPIYDFFKLLEQYPRSTTKELMRIAELDPKYLEYSLNYYPEMDEDYKKILTLRKSKNSNYQYCNKCKIRKSSDKFIKFELNEKYASICKLCADENLEIYRKLSSNPNYAIKKDIQICKAGGGPHKFNRARLSKSEDPMYCKKHQNYSEKYNVKN